MTKKKRKTRRINEPKILKTNERRYRKIITQNLNADCNAILGIVTHHVISRLSLEIERHCRHCRFAPRFFGRATSDGFYVVLQLLRLHVCMHIPTRALWQTEKERRELTLERREDCRAQWWMSAGLNFAKFQALPLPPLFPTCSSRPYPYIAGWKHVTLTNFQGPRCLI